MTDILPIFYCNSSSKSILTSWLPSECSEGGAKSIIALAKEAKLQKVMVISNNFHNFVELSNNCKANDLQLIFGLEILMCPNNLDHTEDSIKSNFKVIVFMKNGQGYYDLIKLFSGFRACKEAKYYDYRCDFATLKKYWTDNLILSHPFFDNFLAVNTLIHGANIIPDFPDMEQTFFIEQETEHPHEELISRAVYNFTKGKEVQVLPCKSIYYDRKSDAKAWITYRAILNRGTFSNPGLEYCCSDTFSFEKWKELTGTPRTEIVKV